MIKYFFKLAFRNFRKYKVNTFISLLGLTVGLASFILIASYFSHELSFNKDNENFENIFIGKINHYMPMGVVQGSAMPYPVVEGLISDFPEVEYGVRFGGIYNQLANGDLSFFERNASYVDNSFFKIFTVNFLGGDKVNPLEEPYTIVLTKKIANKYFNDEDPIGKSLLFDGKYSLEVTAVIENFPINSDFRYDFFVSMKTKLAIEPNRDYTQRWGQHHFKEVFLLNKNCDYKALNKKLAGFFDDQNEVVRRELILKPLSMHHLKKHDEDNSFKVLVIFGLIAIFILVIACINFINLSIANAANRIKETSIRRIVGSKKSSLILQQIGESVLLAFISFDLAYLIAERLLPNFNAMLQAQIPPEIILNFSFISGMLLIAMLLGIVSGIFPALKIGRIHPLRALSGIETSINKAGIGKKGLVVFQYVVSIVLIIGTIILSKQFDYIQNKDLGFDKEYLITANIGGQSNEIYSKLEIFKDEISRYAGVQSIALSRTLPFYGNNGNYIKKEGAPDEEVVSADFNMIEESFFETFNIDVKLKKDFSENKLNSDEIPIFDIYSADALTKQDHSTSKKNAKVPYCYINQTAVDVLAFKDPIGKRIVMSDNTYEIVGVYEDFHVSSLQDKIPPQILILAGDANNYRNYDWMTLKCEGHKLKEIKKQTTESLREFFPDNPYSFFSYGDDDFKADILVKVQGIAKSFGFFTFIAIMIACMGIFGLVALTVKHKTKEIGIRKVLGSSVSEIFGLIARDYLFLVVIGNILAWYPAWYIMNKILQDFAYRINISIWVFALAFIVSILLTIITIAFHTIKAARTNPVEALRYE